MTLEGVNWNKIEDSVDKEVWDKCVANFWVPEKIPLSNDEQSWAEFTEEEKTLTKRVFTGLTLLDTIQATVGAVSLIPDAITPHEEAVYTNFSFMESIHAKSYSSIFSTLCSSEEIEETFRWGKNNKHLQKKAKIITDFYKGNDPLKRKIASTMLESFLFYSGFYLPLHWSAKARLTNSADLIRLIIRDECFTGQTELLTPEGWKYISQVTTEDKVAQYDLDGTVTFVNPKKTSTSVVPGIYRFESEQGHVRQEVSPNHRLLLERRGYGSLQETEYAPEVVSAHEIPQTRLNGYSRFVLAGLKAGGSKAELTAEERLLIAIQADGSFDTTSRNQEGELRRNGSVSGTIPARFSFSKPHKVKRLTALAKEAGWQLTEHKPTPAIGEVAEKRNFNLYVPKDLPTDKRLASISSLEDVTSSWCQEFISEAAQWDGHVVRDNTVTWGSVVVENVEFMQAVAALAGFRTHYTVRPDNRSENFSDYHRLQIGLENRYAGGQRVVKEWVNGEREVYGVEVPSGFLVTRNAGAVNISGNSIHGYYIGYKYQRNLEALPESKRDEYKDFTFELMMELYENELAYTRELYDGVGLTEDVVKFLHYNANKALMNLGYEPMFPSEVTDFNPAVRSSLTPNSGENHDFFSGSGSSYVIGKAEATEDEDWDF